MSAKRSYVTDPIVLKKKKYRNEGGLLELIRHAVE